MYEEKYKNKFLNKDSMLAKQFVKMNGQKAYDEARKLMEKKAAAESGNAGINKNADKGSKAPNRRNAAPPQRGNTASSSHTGNDTARKEDLYTPVQVIRPKNQQEIKQNEDAPVSIDTLKTLFPPGAAQPSVDKSFYNMPLEEKDKVVKNLTGRGLDKSLREYNRVKREGKVEDYWKDFEKLIYADNEATINSINNIQNNQNSQTDNPPVQNEKSDRTIKREEFVNKVKELTGKSIDDAVWTLGELKRANEDSYNNTGYITELSDEYKQLDELINNTPPELFIPTNEEVEENNNNPVYAFAGGIRSGFSLGLDNLIQGREVSPEETKQLALRGLPSAGSVYEKDRVE